MTDDKRHVSEIHLTEPPPEPPPSRREREMVQTQPMFSGNVRDAVEAMIKVSVRVQEAYARQRTFEGLISDEAIAARGELRAALHALTGVRLFLERIVGPKTHTLKTWPGPFRLVKAGLKKYEIRKADRDYAVGDVLVLQEFEPETSTYSGDQLRVRVVTMTEAGNWGLPPDVCVLGIEVEF